jgi:predicted DNA-binding ribbon-helix-helix protein
MPVHLPSANKKRSICIKGFKTSLSLEEPFWLEVRRLAADQNLTIGAFVDKINADRRHINLSCALRLAVLADLRATIDRFTTSLPQAAE